MLSAATASSSATGIELLYYVVASVIAVGGVVIGGARLLLWLRSRWTKEGEQRAASAQVIEANTKAAEDNTKAIGDLGKKLDKFADRVDADFAAVHSELNGHGARITRVELQQGLGPAGPNGGGR